MIRKSSGLILVAVFSSYGCGDDGDSMEADAGSQQDTGTNGGETDSGPVAMDAGTDAGFDAGPVEVDAGCRVGEAMSLATEGELDLFGTPSYFNDGQPLPAGTYRVTYVDGCMKYGGGQGWTVNAYAADRACWYLIGNDTSDRIVVPPGTIGYDVGAGAFEDFEDCVAASAATEPVEFELTESKPVGVWLLDGPYSDNLSGVDGRNPRWALESVDCVEGDD